MSRRPSARPPPRTTRSRPSTPNTFIDQYFDVAQETLEAQREVAKNMAKATQSMGETLRKRAESVGQSTQK
jgi:hypothetical protein